MLEAGMNDYVTKPIQLAVLGAALLRWITATEEPSAAVNDASAPTEQEDLSAQLQQLSCLNYPDAMSRMAGKTTLVKRLLLQFLKENTATATVIEAAVEQQDWATAKTQVHTLKGAAGNLGLSRVFEQAYALDAALALTPPPLEELRDQAQQLSEVLHLDLREIEQTLGEPEPVHKGLISADTVHQTALSVEALIALQHALTHFDASAGTLIEQLLLEDQGADADVLQQIAEAIDNFEQEQALELLEGLILKRGGR